MDDKSIRRQEIIDEFKTVYRLAERIMELESQQPITPPENTLNDSACHFPSEPDAVYGHVTHMHYLGEMNGYAVEVCVVCGAVRAYPPVIIG